MKLRSALPIIAAIAAASACGKGKPPAPPPSAPAAASAAAPTAADAGAAPSARTPWVKSRSAEGVALLEAPATVLAAPEGQAAIAPPFRARVSRVLVRPGERVRKGQPLVEVVMPDVVQAAGAYASATTRVEAYARRKAQLDALKSEGLVRLSDLLEAETKLAEARADQQGSLATLRAAQLEAADAARILSGTGQVPLKSPIDGMAVAVHAAIGETRDGIGEPFVRVAGSGPSRVEARFARAWPEEGARYTLVVASGTRFPARLVGRAPVVDPKDGTLSAWFEPPEALPHGLAGRIEVSLASAGDVAAVPARAVLLDAGRSYVVANRGGKATRVPVEVLASSGAEALVRGLAPGEEVAADAALAPATDGSGS